MNLESVISAFDVAVSLPDPSAEMSPFYHNCYSCFHVHNQNEANHICDHHSPTDNCQINA
jgi:hypothetical protein